VNYVGHAEKWRKFQVRYQADCKTLAVVAFCRNRGSLRAELALERN
jgi:hypothetical protein